jgi:predicted 2-oxoglutarate/Fe(II)-dependent dioxygenase YbiX
MLRAWIRYLPDNATDTAWQQKPLRAISVPRVLTPAQCETLRRDALAAGLTKVGSLDAGDAGRSNLRTRASVGLPLTPERDWLFDLILAKTELINHQNWRFALNGIEELRIVRYKPLQRAKWHFDTHVGSHRKIICVVNLSSPASYWGGGLQVKGRHEGKDIAPQQGSATWFPAYLEHRAKAPWRGERWSMVAILSGPTWV